MVFSSIYTNAQLDSLTMDLNFKTRAEGDNGYSTLIPENKNLKTDVASRARIGMNFYLNQLEIRIAAQDARTWGNTSSSNSSETVSFYEAWAKYNFSPSFYLKAGRQAIGYGNGRVIWESDWGIKGKTHDALMIGFDFENGSSLNAVATYNSQNSNRNDELENEFYSVFDGGERTKSMQLLHYQNSIKNDFYYSALLMNSIVQTDDGKHNPLITTGFYLSQKFNESIKLTAHAYYQTGKNTADQTKNAYNLSLNLNYLPYSFWNMNLGGEILSGTKYNEDSKKNKSFSPLYGTSHTFNGYMDYFYSSGHLNGPGLLDLNFKNNFNLNTLGKLYVAVHYFSSHEKFTPTNDNYLGTEIDLVYGKNFGSDFLLNFGYSQIFASSNLKALKDVPNAKNLQNFVWLGLSFTPQFKVL